MAKVSVIKLGDGSGYKFSARLLGNDARNLDIALREAGFEVDQREEQATITSDQMEKINSFYGD